MSRGGARRGDPGASQGVFSEDWSVTRHYWRQMFREEGLCGKPGLRFLEIGAFEGMASVWLLSNVLTQADSSLTVIDTFEGSPEHGPMGVDTANLEERFRANVERWAKRVDVLVGRSDDWLPLLRIDPRGGLFHFIYVDGSHRAQDVLADAVQAWPLLGAGGLMVFDDLAWDAGLGETQNPRLGIEAFAYVFQEEALPVYVKEAAGAQLVLRKRNRLADARLGIK